MTRNLASLQLERPGLDGREIRLQFKVFGAGARRKLAHLGPLRALVFHLRDGWQGQRRVRPMGSGTFEVTLPTPGTGSCCLFLAGTKPGSGYEDLPCLIFQTAGRGSRQPALREGQSGRGEGHLAAPMICTQSR